MSAPFPIFDLSRFEAADAVGRRLLGIEVDAICRSTGFLAISGHGVPQGTIDAVWSKARDFFDLSVADKEKVRAPFPGYPYGYLGPGAEALAKSKGHDTPPDLKESFNGGPLAVPEGLDDPQALAFCYAETIWPPRPDGFVEAWKSYYRAMEGLASRIMRVFAVALDLPESFFDRTIDRPISALRALNYPETHVPPKHGQLRAGAHTDYGSLTILLPQPGSSGLQIYTPEGEWREVPPVDGAFVINIGDLMARWTNDRWVSTLHRVVNADGSAARRQSLAFFHQPNWHQEIACIPSCLAPGETPRYEPVLSGPYLMSKFQATVKPAA
ncbi:2OG-Fe(II) oxygenase family protein [Mesorhizobium sp. LHD-90]|uniref:isopenicillin N synthase family dioxygenase n=1 Tax=Mesorhizobium sp. LHD-90 TaxID=3071414 RepID=UPI0027E122EE|nr:2OG-Fe(II) oxygenase family protein [Mesorhizobium sp. LHD-90]MDQ6437709.1 2OG-Fe(II) oxygenase family protein [Mesorhizobium sp. LHD-90]